MKEIRACAPKPDTKEFAIVAKDGEIMRLNAEGNAKATRLVRNEAHQKEISVEVTGQEKNRTIDVSTISMSNANR